MCDHLCFLICRATDHEDNDVLRFVPGLPSTFHKWMSAGIEAAFDEVLQSRFEKRRVLGVHVLDATEATIEARTGRVEETCGLEEVRDACASALRGL